MFIWGSNPHPSASSCRGVAQLVAHTAGGREVASSSLVTPTKLVIISWMILPSRVRSVADSLSPEPTADEGKFKSCHPDQVSHYFVDDIAQPGAPGSG